MQITIFSVWMTFVWCQKSYLLLYHFIFVLSDQACRPGGIAMDESGIRRQPV